MKFEQIKNDSINVINESDKKYYDKCYHITFSITNNITPTFEIFADCEQTALDILIDSFDTGENTENNILFDITIDDNDNDNYIVAGNYCRYIEVGSFNIVEITEK
jgi:hypothetical protein